MIEDKKHFIRQRGILNIQRSEIKDRLNYLDTKIEELDKQIEELENIELNKR